MSGRDRQAKATRTPGASRRLVLVAGGTAVILVFVTALVIAGTSRGCDSSPQLHVDDSVRPDLELLALETWDQFLEVFEARGGCFGPVTLKAVYDLDARAGYDPDTASASVRVPGTRAMLQSAMVHEWAHHVEFQCGEHEELRSAFIAAQGLEPDTPWRPDDLPFDSPASRWARIPSEQYAEAAVVLVLGERQIPTKARVKDDAVRVLEQWASSKTRPEGK